MSKIGKQPVEVKSGITVSVANDVVKVTGPKGELTYVIPPGIAVAINENNVFVSQKAQNDVHTRPLFGLTRAMIANMIKGVSVGFEKKLELAGVGYRAQVQEKDLVLSLGFSHPVRVSPLPGITFSVSENVITVSGADRVLVGNTAAQVRKIRPPEPYKGKGIKYVGERIRRKAGKAAKAVGGGTK